MPDTQAIGARLHKCLPFLRQMLNGLKKECPQYIKINALCDIIEKRKNVKYDTLEKCEKVVQILQNKARRIAPEPPPPPPNKDVNGQLPVGNGVGDELKSPDDEIRSPDDDDGVVPERYENERPSIYSVVAESIQPPGPVAPAALRMCPTVPKVDTSKPPISAEDLDELLKTVVGLEKPDPGVSDDTDVKGKDEKKDKHRSKVSLVPTPFHKKMRKNHNSNNTGDKTDKTDDKVKRDNKDRDKDKSKVYSDRFKVIKKSEKSDDTKDKVKKDLPKDKSKDKDRKCSRVVEKVQEADSIFGSLLSSLDEKFISEKEKDKTVRRDSKDSDGSKCEGGGKVKPSKDIKDMDRDKDREKLASKIRIAKRDMAAALKKSGLSIAEQNNIRHKYKVKIKRYNKERDALKRCSKSSSGSKDNSKERRKSDDKNKIKVKDKHNKSKDKERKKSDKEKKPRDSVEKVVQDEEKDKTDVDGKDHKDVKKQVATVAPMAPASSSFIIKKKTDEKATTVTDESEVQPLEPPPLPLGFQDFNPFANEIAESNRMNAARKARAPLQEVGNDHVQHKIGLLGDSPGQVVLPRDPRDPRDPRMRRGPPTAAGQAGQIGHAVGPMPRRQEFGDDGDRFQRMAPRMGPQHFQRQQGLLPPPRSHSMQGRWEPPPNNWGQQESWSRGPLQGHNAGFHPFDPIGNPYDLSQMGPVDFYSPSRQPGVAQNYRQWRELKQRDEQLKKAMEEAIRIKAEAESAATTTDTNDESKNAVEQELAVEATVEPKVDTQIEETPEPEEKKPVIDHSKEDTAPETGEDTSVADGLDLKDVDKTRLLQLLSKAKKMKAPAEKIFEMMETFLQTHGSSTEDSTEDTPPEEDVETPNDDTHTQATPGAEGESTEMKKKDTETNEDIQKTVDEVVEEQPKVEVPASDSVPVSESVPDSVPDSVPEPVTAKKSTPRERSAEIPVKEEDLAFAIGRRLRRRTKSINYNEIKISDSEDSPKGKRKRMTSEAKDEPATTPESVAPKIETKNEETQPEVAQQEITDTPTKAKDEEKLEDSKTEEVNAPVLVPEPIKAYLPPNLLDIIEGVANGSICVKHKLATVLDRIAQIEKANQALDTDEDTDEEEHELVNLLNGAKNSPCPSPIPNPKKMMLSTSTPKSSKPFDFESEKPSEKKRVRKSELDKLHQDIKDSLGDGIMGTCRRSNNASSRTSSPASVISTLSTATNSSFIDSLDLKDVKLTPGAGEALKKGKQLRVVLEKLPDTHDMCVSPSVTRHRLSRASKISVSYAEDGVKRLLDTSEPEASTVVKRRCLGPVPDKNYFLKFEKTDANICELCDFTGPTIVNHYVQEHPEEEVLISRLPPDATQEAFQESILNDYASVTVTNLGGKKPARFDFRCRFCSHDLQKETTATFYDHVSTHTGEQRYHCTECPFKHHVKPTVKHHISFEHGKHQEPRTDEPPKNFDKLFGFICSECNYLQLKKDSITEHIERFHKKDSAYVYTINMSLPILQPFKMMYKRAEENLDMDVGGGAVPERRLRSSQRLKKVETPANVKSVVAEKKPVVPKSSPSLVTHEKEDKVQEVVHKLPPKPPKSAFVCDNLDELLNITKGPVVVTTAAPKRNSSFLDELKKRLDEQEKAPLPPAPSPRSSPVSTSNTVYSLPPIDTEVQCTSELGDSEPETEADVEDNTAARQRQESIRNADDPNQLKNTTTITKRLPLTKLLRPAQKQLVSVGIIDAMIDVDGGITYVCRKSSCIFRTTDSRVHQVHCSYTHQNSFESLECSFCPTTHPALTMSEVFAHLCHHVESYQQSKITPPGQPEVTIKVEKEEEPEPPAVVPRHTEPLAKALKEEETNPPKMFFKISKVESLAAGQGQTVPSEPPPLAPLTNVRGVASKEVRKTPSPQAKEMSSITCKLVPLPKSEVKKDRKCPKVVATWLQQGLSALFKCPQYECTFYTPSEEAFETHIKSHDFKDTLIPCLYCNFKMTKEFIKIHLMMRHAHSPFGCGHCLYRARKTDYVSIHHEVSHPEKSVIVQKFDLSELVNRYRPPLLPALKNIIKPLVCGCGRSFYCTKNYDRHRADAKCPPGSKSDFFYFNCRYCISGAGSITDVTRHIAIEHPFHDVAIVCRQLQNDALFPDEPADVLEKLIILEASAAVSKPQLVVTSPTSTSAVGVTNVSEKVVHRIMLVHPVVLTKASAPPSTSSPVAVKAPPKEEPVVPNVPTRTPPAQPAPPAPPAQEEKTEVKPGNIYRCNQCTIVCDSSWEFLAHLHDCKSDQLKSYVCYHCKKAYKHPSTLVDHMRIHGFKNLICGLCSCREAQLSLLKKHVKEVHKLNNIVLQAVNPEKTNIDVDCFIGKPVVTTPKEPVIEAKLAGVTPDDVQNVFGPSDIALVPMRPIFKSMAVCKICNFSSKVRSNFLRHLQLHESGKFDSALHVGEAVNPVPCLEKNELMFDKMTNLAASSFEGRMGPKTAAAATGNPAAETDVKDSKESVHIPEYIPENRRYICGATGCNYLCLEEQNLRHHIQALHDNDVTYTCGHCKQVVGTDKSKFIDIDCVIDHLRLHDRTLYKCPYCDFLNGKSSNVYRHCMDKHAEKAVKSVTIRQEAVVEDAAHALVAEKSVKKRPWKCGICACRKPTETEMRAHVKEKHTLDAQFKCTYCQFKNDAKTAFAAHFAESHPSVKTDVIVAYYREEKEEEEKTPTVGQFDTTPLWVRNRDTAKNIRGILVEMDSTSKVKLVKSPVTPVKVPKEKEKPKEKSPIKRGFSVKNTDVPAVAVKQPKSSQDTQDTQDAQDEEVILVVVDDVEEIPKEAPPIIEIDDDDEVGKGDAAGSEDPSDPSVESLLFMSVKHLLRKDYISTYGPFGQPRDGCFACPLCDKVGFVKEELFLQHLYDELQYNRYECTLCHIQTTTFAKMKVHYDAKHLVLCEGDSVKELEQNGSIELWLRKVLIVQRRIITFLKKRISSKWFKCGHCSYKTPNRTQAVAHCRAAHASLPVNVLELKEVPASIVPMKKLRTE